MQQLITKVICRAGVGEQAQRLLVRLRAHPFRVRDGPADKSMREGPLLGCGPPRRSRWGPIHGPPGCKEGPSNETEMKNQKNQREDREDKTMSINIKPRPGGLLLAMLFAIGLAPSVWAQTAAGVNVTNQASVDYDVGGIDQTDINSNTDDFEVDRLIDLTVVESSTTNTSITPDQTTFGGVNGTLRFTITNTGNDVQDIAVLAANQADATTDPFGGNTDSWDAQGAINYYLDLGVAGTFEPGGADTALPNSAGTFYIDELASGASVQIWVEFADMPANDPGNTLNGDPDQNMDNGENAVVSMVGTVRAGGGAAALGIALVNDTGADVQGTVQTVFGDADGPYDGALDAAESDDDAFRVSTAVISITKSSAVISDPINLLVNPKRIPGATVRYTITVTNGAGAATADPVIITDVITSTDITYVTGTLYESADSTCDTSDTLLTDAVSADRGHIVGATVTFGDSTGVDLALAASATRSYCYDVTIN